uniref:Tetratricopeptide repeat protein 30 n=1 Tax=Romanomermis culicivorax TaxID=13658 RepID=A0A915KF60_ROMCU
MVNSVMPSKYWIINAMSTLITFQSRAALSLLAYCFYNVQDYSSAAECYENLTQEYPDNDDYNLYRSCNFEAAFKVVNQIDNPLMLKNVLKLKSAIKYAEEDWQNAKLLVEQCSQNDSDTVANSACLLYKEKDYLGALKRFQQAQQMYGYRPDLAYNIALCHYEIKQYAQALKCTAEIIEKGVKEHPELSVGMLTEGMEVRSVGNTPILRETSLIEAFNLKAAIEYSLKNNEAALEALTDMPPRDENELDSVTLHNQALMNIESQPAEGFAKLQFLLQDDSFPPETFANILFLYCKYEYFDLTADLLAENAHLTYKYLSQYEFDFLDALITQQTSSDEAFKKFDLLAAQLTEKLRRATKQVQDGRQNGNEDVVRQAVGNYDGVLEMYIPVLMSQAKIYWLKADYDGVEKLFRKSVDFCSEHHVWRLNVAHTLFMQETKFKEAAGFYESIVKKHYSRILNVSAVVLANLCVCYIMTNQNEAAEELMRKVEKEEEKEALDDSETKLFHLCIVNLVIGTLYCSKGNYEFGISRVIKAMEPYSKKLGTDTWLHVKRCFLSLIENLAKQIILVRDSVLNECSAFLEQCEIYGRYIKTYIDGPLEDKGLHGGKITVTYESRYLKALLLQVMKK